jgi:hypothetical protein
MPNQVLTTKEILNDAGGANGDNSEAVEVTGLIDNEILLTEPSMVQK